MATTFIDGTTPLDAAAFNGIEDEIEEVRGGVDDLSDRFGRLKTITITADSASASDVVSALQNVWSSMTDRYSYIINVNRSTDTRLVAVGICGKYSDTYGGVILFGISASYVNYYRLSSGNWDSGASLI